MLNPPGNPLTHPSHPDTLPPPPEEVEPLPGIPPRVPHTKSFPPARRLPCLVDDRHLGCRRREPPPALPPHRPRPGVRQTRQAPSPPSLSGRATPARGRVLREIVGVSSRPRRGSRQLRSLRRQSEAADESWTPSPQAPGHRPHRPEVAASSRTRGLSLPGGRAVHMAALRAPEGEGALGEGGLGSRRGEGDAAQPRGPSGANMAGGGGVSRSRRGRGSCGRRRAVLRATGS